jgi:hypothetical protein
MVILQLVQEIKERRNKMKELIKPQIESENEDVEALCDFSGGCCMPLSASCSFNGSTCSPLTASEDEPLDKILF